MDDDRDLAREIVQLYFKHYPGRFLDVSRAVSDGDAGQLQMAAHALKGSVANIAADEAAELAYVLERMARKACWKGLSESLMTWGWSWTLSRTFSTREDGWTRRSLRLCKASPDHRTARLDEVREVAIPRRIAGRAALSSLQSTADI